MTRPGTTPGRPPPHHPPLEPRHWQGLLRLIQRRTGIIIREHQRDNLQKTIHLALERFGIDRSETLLSILENCPPQAPELVFLIGRITVGESYFFRDDRQIDFLRDFWLREIIERRQREETPLLRLWSAGCADGQEAVTLAILLLDNLPDADRWSIHLSATDINLEALQRAATGIYPRWSFRTTPATIRDRHFEPHGPPDRQLWRLREPIRNRIHYSHLNLVDDRFAAPSSPFQTMDLILCRNVFIYFDAPTVKRLLKNLVTCLAPGGTLMLGASDTILEPIPGCHMRQHGDNVYYQRGNQAFPETDTDPAAIEPPPMPVPTAPPPEWPIASPPEPARPPVPAPPCQRWWWIP